MNKIQLLLKKFFIILSMFLLIFSPYNVLAEDITSNSTNDNITEQEENESTVDENANDSDYLYSDNEDETLETNNDDSNNTTDNKINKIEENTDKLEKKVSSGHSLNIILVELFCGIIGVVMLVIANKTTE